MSGVPDTGPTPFQARTVAVLAFAFEMILTRLVVVFEMLLSGTVPGQCTVHIGHFATAFVASVLGFARARADVVTP